MSRDGDSGSMASRRRVWYYQRKRDKAGDERDDDAGSGATHTVQSTQEGEHRADLTTHRKF